jgi:hypothetical protein
MNDADAKQQRHPRTTLKVVTSHLRHRIKLAA